MNKNHAIRICNWATILALDPLEIFDRWQHCSIVYWLSFQDLEYCQLDRYPVHHDQCSGDEHSLILFSLVHHQSNGPDSLRFLEDPHCQTLMLQTSKYQKVDLLLIACPLVRWKEWFDWKQLSCPTMSAISTYNVTKSLDSKALISISFKPIHKIFNSSFESNLLRHIHARNIEGSTEQSSKLFCITFSGSSFRRVENLNNWPLFQNVSE